MTISYSPTLKQLRYLVALSDHGHFGRAAAASLVTQSTLSAAIAELESLLGAVLVERTKRRVIFTPLGDAVVDEARPVLLAVDDIVRLAEGSRAPLSGTLRLGVIPTISPFLLPRALPALRGAYPDLQLFLKEDLSAPLIKQLEAGALDLVLLALPYDCGNAETTVLFRDKFSVVCRADDPLAARKRVRPEMLPPDSLLLLEDGHCLRDHALSACKAAARGGRALFEATSLFTLVQMVANGLGVTLVPRLALDAGVLEGTGLATVALRGGGAHRDIGLAWRRGSRRGDEFRMLGDVLSRFGVA